MFKDRAFNLSVLFSTTWHMFWICMIGIIITPSVQPSNFYQEVSFLGPILEKTAFDIMAETAKPQAETMYARSTIFIDNVYLRPEGPKRKVLKIALPEGMRDKLAGIFLDDTKGEKGTPVYYAEDIRAIYRETGSKKETSSIEGPVAERKIIFKPDEPVLAESLYGNSEEYIVKLKFSVSPKGLVYNVEPVVSSGHPEVDIQAVGFIKKWRFSTSEDKIAWGIVPVNIKTK